MNQETIKRLGEAFPFEDVEAKIQVTSGDKKTGMVVFYLDSRAIQKRLDDVVGHFNWKNQYAVWQEVENNESKKMQKSQLCGIAIYNAERNEWIGKFDGAECSNIEPVKGGLSDSFKRAACVWGIGRYLYEIDGIWVEIEPMGKSYRIKSNQQSKLKTAYETAIKQIFGASPQTSDGNTSNVTEVSNTQKPLVDTKQQPAPPTAAPTTKNNQKPPTPAANSEQKKPVAGKVLDFKVHSIKPAGSGSKLLELFGGDGEIISAYVKPGENGIIVGSQLRKVQIEKKSNVHGNYNLLSHYEIAA
jgi:hypothetical protein